MCSIGNCARLAQKLTRDAASVKAWRVTTKADRALQEEARKISANRGYILATDGEIFAKFGELQSTFRVSKARDQKPHIWAIMASVPDSRGRVRLSVVSVW